MKSILFVCTGNIFRSMTAEYAFKAVVGSEPPYQVSSAGTVAQPQAVLPVIEAHLRRKDVDISEHRQRKLTEKILGEADLVVAMGWDHKDFIANQFNREAVLFNQVCYGRAEPVLDVGEVVSDWKNDRKARNVYAISVVDHIYEAMPSFLENVDRFLNGREEETVPSK